jgi:subtilisin family serine protease
MKWLLPRSNGSARPSFLSLLALSVMIACVDAPNPVEPVLSPTPASSIRLEGHSRPDTIINRYVVVLRNDVGSALAVSDALVAQFGGLRFYVYETALKGFAVVNLPEGAVQALRLNPLVVLVEEDKVMQPLQSVQQLVAPRDTGMYLLDRIDQRNLPLNWQYSYTATGQGVHVYIIDSGIRGGHEEWGYGRIGSSAAFIMWSNDPSPTIDQLGHGTAVTSAAAGTRLGVAKQATIHSVRIDDGESGAHTSDIVAGLDWVAGARILPAVANLSYGHNSGSIASAITGVINAGVTFVTAAGNDGVDACDPSTQVASVVTVGATVVSDYRSTYSNVGPCLDLFAPGGDLYGYYSGYGLLELASNAGNTDYTYNRGTSFASPAVAGVAALALQQNSSLSPAAVADLLVQSATANVVMNPGPGSPNRLLYSAVTVPPPPPSFTVSVSGPFRVNGCEGAVWTATQTGGVPPITYGWTVEGYSQNTGTDNHLYYTNTGSAPSIFVQVTATDSRGVVATSSNFKTNVTLPGSC